jgi:ABC-type glycerol-3-phosphate transport system substrate-binding protein
MRGGCAPTHTKRPVPRHQRSAIARARRGGALVLLFAADERDHAVYRPLIQQFEHAYPQIAIHLVALDNVLYGPVAQSEGQTTTLLERAAQHADVFPAFLVPQREYASPLLLDLKPYMDADPHFDPADLFPRALDHARHDARMWMVPVAWRIPFLMYNETLLSETGLAPPSLDWTWHDALAIAEHVATTRGAQGDTYGLLDPGGGVLALSGILQARGHALRLDGLQDLQLDRPELSAAVAELRRLHQVRALLLPGRSRDQHQALVDVDQLARVGRIALWPEDSIRLSPDASSSAGPAPQFQYIVFPTGVNPIAGLVTSGYAVSGGTRHAQAAWQWLAFLSRQELRGLGNIAGHIPARQSLVAQHDVWQRFAPQRAAAYQAALAQQAAPAVRDTDVDPITLEFMQRLMGTIHSSPQAPAEILATAQQELQQQLAQAPPAAPSPARPLPVATPPPQRPADLPTITFMTTDVLAFEPKAETFHATYPGRAVDVVSTYDLTHTLSVAAMAHASDCFLWDDTPTEEAWEDAVRDLLPLLDGDAALSLQNYPPVVVARHQREGRLLGLPYAFQPAMMAYNQDLFEAAGVDPPAVTWTPAQFFAAAVALTQGSGAQRVYGYAPYLNPGWDLVFFVQQFGGQLVTGSGVHAQPRFTDPTVLTAIRWYLDLALVHEVMPTPTFIYKRGDYFDPTFPDLAQSGRVGMWLDWWVYAPEAEGVTLAAAPLPLAKRGLSAEELRTEALYSSAHTQQAELCWEWFTFVAASLPDSSADIPARTVIAQGEAFRQQAAPETLALAQAYVTALAQEPAPSVWARADSMDWYWFYAALTAVVEDGADLSSALAEAQQKTSAFMACLQEQEEALACALRVDPNYQGMQIPIDPNSGASG